jgi:GNAT superfamily N-acetyltransferase
MRIVDLDESTKPVFCQCLEDWPDDVKQAGDRRRCWVERFTARGLRAKVALDDSGTPGGMIQYLPIEESTVEGEGLYFVTCIWVHGHARGRGDFQGRGMGRALLAAAEQDARARGARGMTAERARRVAGEFGDKVAFREVDTSEHATVAEWGLADALFVDGKRLFTGPPIAPERLRKIVAKRVARAFGS